MASAYAQHVATRRDANTVAGMQRPYGLGDFGHVGARVGIDVDRRDSPMAPTGGFRVQAMGAATPAVWDAREAYATLDATASTYLSAAGPLAPTVALQAGGRHVWGDFPFHDAAQLGGATALRGWDAQRFAGRSSAFGSAEVRARVARVRVIAPTEIGVLGYQDVGRVWADGESSGRWHAGTGGGVWVAPMARTYTVSLSVARGRERTGIYLTNGFAF
jgi:outer membrane protein assembly factor BamA